MNWQRDGLTTRRNEVGDIITIPQFGGVVIENNVQIGANSVVCKGAIDNTVIGTGSRIDNCSFISHNVKMGKNTIVVGKDAFVGMGSVVTKNVPDGVTVKGNPAR